jgi:hypothetical protein
MPYRPHLIFLCPNCNRYTVHMPRLTRDGRWMVDHKLIEQVFFGDIKVTVPYNWCEVDALGLIDQANFTRTVIRV